MRIQHESEALTITICQLFGWFSQAWVTYFPEECLYIASAFIDGEYIELCSFKQSKDDAVEAGIFRLKNIAKERENHEQEKTRKGL